MRTSIAIEKSDISKIEKLNSLHNENTFWDDVRKLTKKVTSDHSIKRWQCLAEIRYEEVKQYTLLSFLAFYAAECGECGSSIMDLVDDYILGEGTMSTFAYEIGSSSKDFISSFPERYKHCKDLGYEIDIRNLRRNNEMFEDFVSLGNLKNNPYLNYKIGLNEFSQKYNFSSDVVDECIW